MRFTLKNMTKRRKIIWDWCSGLFRRTRMAGGYVYGTYGNVLTESLLQDRASVFGGEVTDYMEFIRQNWLGKRCSDCVGLIKGYGWYDSASGEIVVGSNGMADVGSECNVRKCDG